MIRLCLLALIIALANVQIMPVVDASGSFTFVNKCDYTVWPVILSSTGSEPLSTTGFVLPQGGLKTIQAAKSWGGQFWARSQCSQDSTGKFTCLTGDCGSGKIECNGVRGNISLPVTLVEFKLGAFKGLDFYEVNLVDGYNLPLLVVPQSVSPDTCKPTDLSRVLTNLCPRVYSYADDDANSTFTCMGSPDYIITFCPSPATSQEPSSGSPNPSPGGDGDSNSRNNNSYYLPYVNGTVGYDGATNVNSGGASTCIHVLRSQLIAVTVATTVWRLCQHF